MWLAGLLSRPVEEYEKFSRSKSKLVIIMNSKLVEDSVCDSQSLSQLGLMACKVVS